MLSLALVHGCVQLTPEYLQGGEYEKAVILYNNGLLKEARHRAELVEKADPDYAAARRLLARIRSLSSRLAKRHMLLGAEYERAGVYKRALKEYRISLKYKPSDKKLLRRTEALAAALKKEGLAGLASKRARARAAAMRRARAKARAKAAAKKRKKAAKDAPSSTANTADGRTQAKDPSTEKAARYAKAKLFIEAGDYSKAIEELNAVLDIDPGYEEAEALLENAVEERDREVEGFIHKGMLYFNAEEMDLAIREWDRALELDPDNEKAADYRSRAEVILEQVRRIREKRQEKETRGQK